MTAAALIAGAYLLGSVPFSYLLVRILRGRDIRTVGSGNPGATNVLRAAGRAPALAALVLDVGKGAAPVLAARLLAVSAPAVGGVALAAVVGHVFPLFLGFRGGRGVATAGGALGVMAPLPLALSGLIFLGVVARSRYVSLGSVAATGLFPVLALLCDRLGWTAAGPWPALAGAAIAALVVARHADNIRRLWEGTEPKLGGAGSEAGGR